MNGSATGYAAYTDVALVAMVSEGDGDALQVLYTRYGRDVFSLARWVLADDRLAQETLHEVFLTVWREATHFDGRRDVFSSWVLALAHRQAVEIIRRGEGRRRPGAGSRMSGQAWRRLSGERLRRALEELPDDQRDPLLLAYFGGYTGREIAGLTGVSPEAVKTRMLAGTRRLLACLRPEGGQA